MEKINFSNGEKISAAKVTINNVDYEVTPAVYDGATPLNATVFNNMQENIEDAIDEKADSEDVYTKTEVNALIPTKAHQINVGEDTDYRVNILKTKNLFDVNNVKNDVVIDSAGAETTNTNFIASDFILVKPNTTYTVSYESTDVTWGFRIIQYGIDKYNSFIDRANTQLKIYTFTTTANTYYVRINSWKNNTNIQLEEGSTATEYTPFITNQINVDNEKYSDTINVGATEDSRSRVNFLKSRNLFQPTLVNNGTNITVAGTATVNNDEYTLTAVGTDLYFGQVSNQGSSYINANGQLFPVQPGEKYYFALTNSDFKTNLITKYNSSKVSQGYSIINSSSTIYTIPDGVYYISIRFGVNPATAGNSYKTKVILAKTAEEIPYEPYVVPSIKVDNEEIYRKPKVLWENSSPTSNFAGQTIALNDDISNYKYYEIIFKYSKSTNLFKSTGKVKTNEPAFLDLVAFANFARRVTSVSGKNITFANAKYSSAYGQDPDTENSNYLIPIEIIGY